MKRLLHSRPDNWSMFVHGKIRPILRPAKWKMEMENGSILLAPEMRHILASLDSVASAADGIQKEEPKTKLPPWGFEPRPQPAAWIN